MYVRIYAICSLIALFVLLFPATIFASPGSGQRTPQAMVEEMVNRLKRERDPSVLLQYVHWDTAFGNFSAEQRREIGVSNSAEFRNYFEGFFRDPAQFVQRHMRSRLEGMSSEQRSMVEAQLEQMTAMMIEKRRRMDEKISRVEYKIGQVEVQGNAATVELVSSLDGQTRQQTLPLELIDGRWYLPTMKFVESTSGSGLPE